jgi:AraC-like DNA-binding protein
MSNYVIRAIALKGYTEIVNELGGDIDSLYRAAGIDNAREILEDSDRYIPHATYLKLINTAAAELNCNDFGLRLAQKKGVSQLGILSLILKTSPTMFDALETFNRYLHYQSKAASSNLHTEGEFTFWKYTIHYQGDQPLQQAYLNVLGVGNNILRLISSNSLTPICGYSTFNRGSGEAYDNRYFQCPITYNAEFNGWKFKTQDLKRPRPESDPTINKLLQDQLSTLLEKYEQNFELQIKEIIRQSLTIGDPSIDRIARYLSKNRRSLQRQLESHNLIFKNLLEDVRLEMAIHHLRYSNLPLTHIADMLCYNDLSSFSRFFTKRMNASPSAWRKANTNNNTQE